MQPKLNGKLWIWDHTNISHVNLPILRMISPQSWRITVPSDSESEGIESAPVLFTYLCTIIRPSWLVSVDLCRKRLYRYTWNEHPDSATTIRASHKVLSYVGVEPTTISEARNGAMCCWNLQQTVYTRSLEVLFIKINTCNYRYPNYFTAFKNVFIKL